MSLVIFFFFKMEGHIISELEIYVFYRVVSAIIILVIE